MLRCSSRAALFIPFLLVTFLPDWTCGKGVQWSTPETLLTDTTSTWWRLAYQPVGQGDYVLAIASEERPQSPRPEYSRLILAVRYAGDTFVHELASPDPMNPFICHAEPFQIPRAILNRADSSVHVLFGVRREFAGIHVPAIYEAVVWRRVVSPAVKVVSATYPPPDGYFGKPWIKGFGATGMGSKPIVWWVRNDGVWARTYAFRWGKPFLVVGGSREYAAISAAYAMSLGSTTLFAFKGYANRDVRPDVDPRGYYNALYFGNTAVRRQTPSSKPRLSAEFQLLWRQPHDYVSAPYIVVDTTRQLVHIFATVYRQAHTLPDALLYEALALDDSTVVVDPRFLVDLSNVRAYLALSPPVMDSEGRIHLAYYAVYFENSDSSGVWYLSGCGNNWAKPRIVAGPSTLEGGATSLVGYPELKLDSEDTLHLVYIRFTSTNDGGMRNSVLLQKAYALSQSARVQDATASGPQLRHLVCSAFPNPCRSVLAFRMDLPGPGRVTVQIFDVLGRTVWERSQFLSATSQSKWFETHVPVGNWPVGVYIYRVIYRAQGRTGFLVRSGKFVHVTQ